MLITPEYPKERHAWNRVNSPPPPPPLRNSPLHRTGTVQPGSNEGRIVRARACTYRMVRRSSPSCGWLRAFALPIRTHSHAEKIRVAVRVRASLYRWQRRRWHRYGAEWWGWAERKRKADGGGERWGWIAREGNRQQTGAEKTITGGERRKHRGRDKDTRTALDRGRGRKRKDRRVTRERDADERVHHASLRWRTHVGNGATWPGGRESCTVVGMTARVRRRRVEEGWRNGGI